MDADIPEYPSSSPARTASIISFFIGIWVLVSPFVLNFTSFRAAFWNNMIVGIVIMVVAAIRAWTRRSTTAGISWINFALGLWLIISAFVLGFRMGPAFAWNQIIVGIAVAVISAVSAMGRPAIEPPVAP